MNDAKIAREWAEKIAMQEKITFSVDDETLAAARYILTTTTPPTMKDVEWDDDVHSGLCAEDEDYGTVRMLDYDPHDGTILCLTSRLRHEWSAECDLTPIPGTKIDLTPRREPEPEPESTPDHPAELTIAAEYLHAPAGTIVAAEGEEAWTKGRDGFWDTWGIVSGYANSVMAGEARRVLRWGWEA